MSRRAARVLAWSLFALYLGLAVSAVVLQVAGGIDSDETFFAVIVIGYAVCGALIASREPRTRSAGSCPRSRLSS